MKTLMMNHGVLESSRSHLMLVPKNVVLVQLVIRVTALFGSYSVLIGLIRKVN